MSNLTENVKMATADTADAKSSDQDRAIAKAIRNIERLRDAKRAMGGNFLKIQAEETKILQFTGEMDAVEKIFKRPKDDGTTEDQKRIQISYQVLDVTTPQSQTEGPKRWDLSKSWSDQVDNLLQKGWMTLEVKRTGTGTSTKYLISPAVPQNQNQNQTQNQAT
jgi:hypothetical protein